MPSAHPFGIGQCWVAGKHLNLDFSGKSTAWALLGISEFENWLFISWFFYCKIEAWFLKLYILIKSDNQKLKKKSLKCDLILKE